MTFLTDDAEMSGNSMFTTDWPGTTNTVLDLSPPDDVTVTVTEAGPYS